MLVALLRGLRHDGDVVPRRGPAARMPAFYERALRLLARRGLAPDAAETARQFAARVEERAPDRAAAFDRLTGYYERARFGDAALSEAERQEVTARSRPSARADAYRRRRCSTIRQRSCTTWMPASPRLGGLVVADAELEPDHTGPRGEDVGRWAESRGRRNTLTISTGRAPRQGAVDRAAEDPVASG